jgi:hypothetical protein
LARRPQAEVQPCAHFGHPFDSAISLKRASADDPSCSARIPISLAHLIKQCVVKPE